MTISCKRTALDSSHATDVENTSEQLGLLYPSI